MAGRGGRGEGRAKEKIILRRKTHSPGLKMGFSKSSLKPARSLSQGIFGKSGIMWVTTL